MKTIRTLKYLLPFAALDASAHPGHDGGIAAAANALVNSDWWTFIGVFGLLALLGAVGIRMWRDRNGR